ncbi:MULTISPECIES: hypothetical protein [Bacillus cereus group]|uniref:hypothetical protein n=1 Tax=Bacillus cereus group TaxID=86661 RepID=UPI00080F5AFF|nr:MULTISPECIES: hypothetical protein [Bacillus cereus group]ANV74407.1 hypothetical protein BCM43_28585 [Bacillus thuringiensis]MCU7756975.1 hypothetical protein [Bacillus cereus]MDA2490960.1 hypothetical protein [Bacillus cereus]MDC7752616.1 hypothetical protein [Bacillus cereus]PFD09616.1 hypothetical protein CN295_22430 [Bacillus cereus]
MNNKLLLALTNCVLIIGLAACLSNETARNSNDSKAEEKVKKETEKVQKAGYLLQKITTKLSYII